MKVELSQFLYAYVSSAEEQEKGSFITYVVNTNTQNGKLSFKFWNLKNKNDFPKAGDFLKIKVLNLDEAAAELQTYKTLSLDSTSKNKPYWCEHIFINQEDVPSEIIGIIFKELGYLEEDEIANIIKKEGQVEVPEDKSNRFNVIFQKMMSVRWYITFITMITLLAILCGIVLSIMVKATMAQEWKEILLLILGAFIGSYNRVIDFWFNNSQRDQIMLQKIDEEDDPPGTPKSETLTVSPAQDAIEVKMPEPIPVKSKESTDESK